MIHAILDAARMGSAMATAKELTDEHSSLYKGESMEKLADFAPYLFMVSGQSAFTTWVTAQGWGDSWGIYLESSANPADLYHHFRKFLLVRTEAGKELYFRFYDPRVLRQFLPTSDAYQLTAFFGPVRYFLLEDADPDFAVRYWLEARTLRQQRLTRAEAEQLIRSC